MNVKFYSFDNEISPESPIVIADTYKQCVKGTLEIGEFSKEQVEEMMSTPNIEQIMEFSVKQMLVEDEDSQEPLDEVCDSPFVD